MTTSSDRRVAGRVSAVATCRVIDLPTRLNVPLKYYVHANTLSSQPRRPRGSARKCAEPGMRHRHGSYSRPCQVSWQVMACHMIEYGKHAPNLPLTLSEQHLTINHICTYTFTLHVNFSLSCPSLAQARLHRHYHRPSSSQPLSHPHHPCPRSPPELV